MSEAAKNNGQAIRGRYVLRERLGIGGQGEVWRAFDPQTGVDIALKIMQPASGRSAAAWVALVHEHESSGRLDHPGILHVYAPERDGATFILPMELAAGGDLRRLRGANYLTIIPILLEVAKALEHAHERGIIHRDLKPGNVLFDAQGRVKLADFGVSGRSADSGAGSMRGLSPFTASPEQLRGEAPMIGDDIYGLGALAYELLSRNPPHYPHFDAERMQNEPVPPLVPAQQIPPQLAALVTAMLDKDPRKRPASMRDVIDELDAALNDTLTFEFDPTEPEHESEPMNRPASPPEPLALPPATVHLAPAEPAQPVPLVAVEVETVTPARGAVDGEALWREVKQVPIPRPPALEPIRSGVPRALLVVTALAAVAAAVYFGLPRSAPGTAAGNASAIPVLPSFDSQAQARFMTDHALLEQRVSALEARGAAIWGGGGFMSAKTRAAEASGAQATGNADLARQDLAEATQLLNAVDEAAPGALAAELSAGDQAIAAGQLAAATQAYDLAVRISPQDERALAGQAQARQRTAAAYPGEQAPKAPPSQTDAVFGEDRYAKAAGEGFAALGAGRLAEARAAFERARALRPDGAEGSDGIKRVDAAEHAHGTGTLQTRAEDLEADEQWAEALALYSSALRQNPSLAFAQEGKARTQARVELSESLQGFIDRPDLLATPAAREQANDALRSAEAISSPGPVLRLQMARVSALLPEFDKTARLTLVSDGLTQVSIAGIGSFGGFSHRDVELKPGRYTVLGTREGYHEVRRDITVTPGQPPQTINVTCYDPS